MCFLSRFFCSNIGQRVYNVNKVFAEKSSSTSACGWIAGKDGSAKSFASGKAIGHWGFTGTGFWLDTERVLDML